MAGILDNKSRIMDVFVTELGRRQIAGTPGGGQLRVEYASFTDGETFYQEDVVSGSADATNRIFFEATNRKQDFITFETDDSGVLLGFEEDPSMTILNGDIFIESPSAPRSDFSAFTYTTGSRFASVAESIVTSSLDHFKDLRLIGSLDSDEPINRQFLLDRNKVNFVMTNTYPWGFFTAPQMRATISDLDPMFVDKKLSNIINFRFLPPIIVDMEEIDPDPWQVQTLLRGLRLQGKWLGSYFPLGLIEPMTFSDLLEELNGDVTPPRPPPTPPKKFDLWDAYGDSLSTDTVELTAIGADASMSMHGDTAVRDFVAAGYTIYKTGEGGLILNPSMKAHDMFSMLGGLTNLLDNEKDWDFGGEPVFKNTSWLRTSSRKYLDGEKVVNASDNPMAYPYPSTVPNVPRETVYFKESSSKNNIVMQMFEINRNINKFKKLDVIDFGEVSVSYDSSRPTKHIFFAGKIFFNELRIPSFVNLFTIILD